MSRLPSGNWQAASKPLGDESDAKTVGEVTAEEFQDDLICFGSITKKLFYALVRTLAWYAKKVGNKIQ